MPDLVIQIGNAFEKKLAELCWENCTELARQTAAQTLALSLDFNAAHVQRKAREELVNQAVQQAIPDVMTVARDRALEQIGTKAIQRQIDKTVKDCVVHAIDQILGDEVHRVCTNVFRNLHGGFKGLIEEQVREMVSAYLLGRLKNNETAKQTMAAGRRTIEQAAKENKDDNPVLPSVPEDGEGEPPVEEAVSGTGSD